MPSADLDELYGPALPPVDVGLLEAKVRPSSLQRLMPDTADQLKELMRLAEQGLGVAKYVYGALPILWVIDDGGEVWIAVEEIIDERSGAFVRPRLAATARPDSPFHRLGHPALLSGRNGRIGGEILLDIRADPPVWT